MKFVFFHVVAFAFPGLAVSESSAPSSCGTAQVDLRSRCKVSPGADGSSDESASLLQIKSSEEPDGPAKGGEKKGQGELNKPWRPKLKRNQQQDIMALSHVSHNVDVDVREAADFYKHVLGFVEAYNVKDPIDDGINGYWPLFGNLPGCRICATVCVGMGIPKCLIDIKWIWHPQFNLYFELFYWHFPKSKKVEQRIDDTGSWKHVALEVTNATEVYHRIKDIEGVKVLGPPKQLEVVVDGVDLGKAGFMYFYWQDKYGIFWEMEATRPTAEYSGVNSIYR